MALDQLLRRNFWIALIPLVMLAALLNAKGVTQLVGISLGADEKQLSAPPLLSKAAPTAAGSGAHATNADAILSRNPFDSVTGSLNKKAPIDENPTAPPSDLSDPKSLPACDGVKVLVIAASGDKDWSFAVLSQGGEKDKTVLRRRGGEFNGKTVFFVGWDRIWMGTGQGTTNCASCCQAELFKADKPAAAPATPAAPPAPAGSGGPHSIDPAIAKGIVKVSATEFNIDRGVVDKILENQADLMRQARIVPEQENGKVVGIRLFGVRPDTLLGVLGMENGDRLQTINGFDMASPEKALEAYARLRTADHLTVQVNRRGQNMNLDYNIK
jgi:general secretion pathway protein C